MSFVLTCTPLQQGPAYACAPREMDTSFAADPNQNNFAPPLPLSSTVCGVKNACDFYRFEYHRRSVPATRTAARLYLYREIVAVI